MVGRCTPSRSEITEENLSPVIKECGGPVNSNNGNGNESIIGGVLPPTGTKLVEAMAAYEQMVIREAIRRHDGDHTRAAKDLGISPQWLRRLLKGRPGRKKEALN